ncbi:MAG: hypothetical protein M3169_17120 [Candidatus Eremiobacteraeota bacterium]|nr:hypothetical protein [Candidatus Eremiobacteraeota bacterium]
MAAGTFVLPPAARADEPVVAVRDERIQLNIAERRIDRGPYETSLQVGINSPLQVRVGVALSTAHISVTLRGVRGDGQFHGDLSRLTRIIAAHHVAP